MEREKNKTKLVMLDHSKAKVDLYAEYLSTYLNILSRVSYIKRIHIYDLMCGEGIYLDKSKGSPIIAMEKIKEHYFKNNKKLTPSIYVWFNDKDKSDIDSSKYKIERVKEEIEKMFVPPNVTLKYTKKDFQLIYQEVKYGLKSLKNEKALLFIDPYGYKDVNPIIIKELLSFNNTEVILFLPISFMYRFANKSITNSDFQGGEALRNFLRPLENKNLNNATSINEFVSQLKISFRDFLKQNNVFVDTFTLERSKNNIYGLFFFTPNELGFEKMLETKWKLDEKHGKGFKMIKDQQSLFSEIEVCDYKSKLKTFISSVDYRTNSELYHFGLMNGFLPKHTNEVLRVFQKTIPGFKVYNLDGSFVRKGAFYIRYENSGPNPKKIVNIKFES